MESQTTEIAGLDETYDLPGEIAIALHTGRDQFLTMLDNKIGAGNVMTPEQQREVLRLLRDLIADRWEAKRTITQLEMKLKDAIRGANGLGLQLERFMAELKDVNV